MSSRFRKHRVLWALVGSVVVACNRYEYIPDYMTAECQNQPRTRSGFAVRFTSAGDVPVGVLTGRIASPTPAASRGVHVLIQAGSWWQADTTDSLGLFRLSNLQPGRYQLVLRRIGFRQTRDSITISERSGVRLEATLDPEVMDGPCSGYAQVPVKKPWWKRW